jgi:hypothetical protein
VSVPIPLGDGRVAYAATMPDGSLAGYRVTHPCTYQPTTEVGSWIPVGHGEWTLVAESPLHLEPSLRCTVCGDHGWIRDGKWVPS